jgi:rare lipoprotein A
MLLSRIAAVLASALFLFVVVSVPGASAKQVKVSWYKCCNAKTASGKPFNASDPTIVAHKCLPFGTAVYFRNLRNGKTLYAKVSDRGPYVGGREFDLTRAGADRLGIRHSGVAEVEATWDVSLSRYCKARKR